MEYAKIKPSKEEKGAASHGGEKKNTGGAEDKSLADCRGLPQNALFERKKGTEHFEFPCAGIESHRTIARDFRKTDSRLGGSSGGG